MRGVITYIALLFIGLMGVGAYAQTPSVIPPGVYQLEEMTSPQLNLTGSWVITSTISGTTYPISFLSSISDTSTVTFDVYGNSLIIYQGVYNHTLDLWELSINGTPQAVSNDYPQEAIQPIPIPLSGISSTVTITRAGTSQIYLDFMSLHNDPTPDPNITYGSISGTDIETQFNMSVTAGDIAISSALLFLLFTIWIVIFIALFVRGKNP